MKSSVELLCLVGTIRPVGFSIQSTQDAAYLSARNGLDGIEKFLLSLPVSLVTDP